jgi:hypothetical protein
MNLEQEGYVVIPCLEANELVSVQHDFIETLKSFPEYKDAGAMVATGEKFVGGGFAALGNPASFHNKCVRSLRLRAHKCVLDNVFANKLLNTPGLKFEQVIDRMLFRRPSQRPGAETWHRDEAKMAKDGDTIYGGWINLNLDNSSQFFSCCPGTHTDVGTVNRGFVPIKKSEKAKYRAISEKIEIPVGHIMIFFERMVHEVLPSSKKIDQHRLFLGWRTTYATEPLMGPGLRTMLRDRAVMPIKSGQIPFAYPRLYWVNWIDKLVQLSENFKDVCCSDRTFGSGSKRAGETYRVVHEFMKSLKEYDLITGLCPEYTEDEIRILTPQLYSHLYDETDSEEEIFYEDMYKLKL